MNLHIIEYISMEVIKVKLKTESKKQQKQSNKYTSLIYAM